MSEGFVTDAKRRMAGAVSKLEEDYRGLRTGRAHPGLLDGLIVTAYESAMPLNQLATVGVADARTLSIQVWDGGLTSAVEKAILDSDLGLNPQTEGNTIRLPLPEVNQERRQELQKVAGRLAEQARVAVRNVRRDCLDKVKKDEKGNELSEDEARSLSDKIQKATDDAVGEIDQLHKAKDAEITKI
ncbi:MAG: ribosome recycling factor [Pseudomonadota bacterium]